MNWYTHMPGGRDDDEAPAPPADGDDAAEEAPE
jgi:hypothetical protein